MCNLRDSPHSSANPNEGLAKNLPSKKCNPEAGFSDWGLEIRIKVNWVAVKELKLSYYVGEILLLTIYTHYGNLI